MKKKRTIQKCNKMKYKNLRIFLIYKKNTYFKIMSSYKSSFVNEILDICITEISKDDTKKKINTYLIEPSFTYIFDRLYPYIILTFIIFILILLMAIIIIIILVRNNKYKI